MRTEATLAIPHSAATQAVAITPHATHVDGVRVIGAMLASVAPSTNQANAPTGLLSCPA
jgi:hypothetical protein